MSHDEKVAMVEGITMGATVASFFLSRVCSNDANALRYGNISMAGLVTEVDVFYKTEEANKPLPISIAVVYVIMRLRGDSKERLQTFLSVMRKTANEK